MRKLILLAVAVGVVFPFRAAAQDSRAESRAESAPVLESGHWKLHKFIQPIGDETYEVTEEGPDRVVTSKFKFTDRGSPVILNATLRTDAARTPRAFKAKGNVSRFSTIDTEITVDGETGFLASSPEEWESRIERLLADPELRQRMGSAGRRRVEERYAMPLVSRRVVELYGGLIGSET